MGLPISNNNMCLSAVSELHGSRESPSFASPTDPSLQRKCALLESVALWCCKALVSPTAHLKHTSQPTFWLPTTATVVPHSPAEGKTVPDVHWKAAVWRIKMCGSKS